MSVLGTVINVAMKLGGCEFRSLVLIQVYYHLLCLNYLTPKHSFDYSESCLGIEEGTSVSQRSYCTLVSFAQLSLYVLFSLRNSSYPNERLEYLI